MRLDILVITSGIVIGLLALITWQAERASRAHTPADLEQAARADKLAHKVFWAVFSLGWILPWAAAIAARQILVSRGSLVMSWDEIWRYLPIYFIPLSIPFAAPHIALAFWARQLVRTHFPVEHRTDLITIGSLIGAVIGLSVATVVIHYAGWSGPNSLESFLDAMTLAPFALPSYLFVAAAIGAVLGRLVVAVSRRYPPEQTQTGTAQPVVSRM